LYNEMAFENFEYVDCDEKKKSLNQLLKIEEVLTALYTKEL
jgi:hypothetical protein